MTAGQACCSERWIGAIANGWDAPVELYAQHGPLAFEQNILTQSEKGKSKYHRATQLAGEEHCDEEASPSGDRTKQIHCEAERPKQ